MTTLEALKGEIEPFSVSNNALVKKLTDYDMYDDDEYEKEYREKIALCAIEILSSMLALNGETMGKISSSYNRQGIKDKIASLCKEYGLDVNNYTSEPSVEIL